MTIINLLKKPEPAKAMAWLGTNAEELRKFCTVDDELMLDGKTELINDNYAIAVKTPSGILYLPLGWWIIKDSDGNLDICDPIVFEDLYEYQGVEISS